MATMRKVCIVQDLESGLFLAPVDGDVGFVHRLKEAGGFDSYEDAIEAMQDHCSHGADILTFWTDKDLGVMW